QIGLADNDRACRFELGDHSGVEVRYPIFEDFGSCGGTHSARRDVVLDREWNTVERPAIFSLSDLSFRLLGLRFRIFRRNGHVSVEKRIQPLDAHQKKTRQFNRRKPALFDVLSNIGDGELFDALRRHDRSAGSILSAGTMPWTSTS